MITLTSLTKKEFKHDGNTRLFVAKRRWRGINDAGQEEEYFSTMMEGVTLVSVCPMMLDVKNSRYEKHNHIELIELIYGKITWTYKDGNIIHSDIWNKRATV